MTLVLRPQDLHARRALSKSYLTLADMCETKAGYSRTLGWAPIPNPRMTFGSAVDAAVEQIIAAVRAGAPIGLIPRQAAAEVADRDEQPIDLDEIDLAVAGFETVVLPKFDWSWASLQPHLSVPTAEWGLLDGHPDILLHAEDGTPTAVLDVKTAQRAKLESDVRSVELGFYALLVQADSGATPGTVGYLTWVRVKRPYWQVLTATVDDDLLAHTTALVDRRAAQLRLAESLGPEAPVMVGGPRWRGLCESCEYAPWQGGPCPIARRGASNGD